MPSEVVCTCVKLFFASGRLTLMKRMGVFIEKLELNP